MVQRLRESDDPRFKELSAEIEVLLAEDNEISPSLGAAAAGGNFELMQELLSKGAEVDKIAYWGRTALVCSNFRHELTITLKRPFCFLVLPNRIEIVETGFTLTDEKLLCCLVSFLIYVSIVLLGWISTLPQRKVMRSV